MKLVTSLQMRECDRRTIAGERLPAPTAGRILMERAGWGIYTAVRQHFGHLRQRPILIFCGRGNNGGDGLVLARLLRAGGVRSVVFMLAQPEALTPDAAAQLMLLQRAGGQLRLAGDEDALAAGIRRELRLASRHRPLLVDALLGTGSQGAPRGLIGACVARMERLRSERDAEVVAVDLPTGVNADTGAVAGDAVHAHVTVTMAFLKAGFLCYPGREYLGRVRVVDIGIPPSVAADVGLPLNLTVAEEARALLPRRAPDVHKGRVGRLVVVGGSPGLSGAPALAGMAAVRAGAGLVTLAVPRGIQSALAAKLTEVMTLACPETPGGGLDPTAEETLLSRAEATDVWALGPGLGRDRGSVDLIRRLVGRLRGPLVIDADGLYALAQGDWWRPQGSPAPILTPHPGEMARLLGGGSQHRDDAPWDIAARYAARTNCILVLKGAPTVIAAPDGACWVNPTGNPGLATGGSGDALTGIIAALLGQGLAPPEAARLGVFLHGLAADHAQVRTGTAGLIPSDLIERLPEAWQMLAAGTCSRLESAAWIHRDGFGVP